MERAGNLPVKAAVLGAAGRMGQRIIHCLAAAEGISLEAAVERPGHPLLGTSIESSSSLNDHATAAITLTDDLEGALSRADVVIDFTSVESTLAAAHRIGTGTAAVIGTTGFSAPEQEELTRALAQVPAVIAPNMSIGVNLLFKLAEMAAAILEDDFDVEIIEAHHRMKKDAPSGTALRAAHVIAAARGCLLDDVAVYGRQGIVGERGTGQIGIHAVRGGDIVGDHTVLFAGPGEQCEIRHQAHSRDTFARGAVRAALWIVNQPTGLYTMQNVLGF